MMNLIKSKKLMFIGLAIIAVILAGLGARKVFGRQTGLTSSDPRVQLASAIGEQDINKDFTFPVNDSTGKKVAQFIYTLEKAELRNEIVIKGQKAVAVAGRRFLVIYVKIGNSENQNLQINTRDYIRLSVNGSKTDLLAPDVHNDPVEVQAASTKYTTLGFAINDADKNLVLSVGEIGKDKTEVPLQKL